MYSNGRSSWLRSKGVFSGKNRSEGQTRDLRLHVSWRARLNEHLGSFHAEPLRARAGALLERRDALAGQISAVLNAAQFENQGATSARLRDLTAQAKALVAEVEAAAP